MRFSLALFVVAATATAAMANPAPAPEPEPAPGYPPPPPPPHHHRCICPKDKYGDRGTNINQGRDWYQCAYPHGACTWSDYGPLQNTKQTNCPKWAPCRKY